jgi:hypothetical protein
MMKNSEVMLQKRDLRGSVLSNIHAHDAAAAWQEGMLRKRDLHGSVLSNIHAHDAAAMQPDHH